ncbi:hypothetical protein Tco_0750100 [Tanacetum coccineum]|uniref:Uncharacterized protein n=1 Tax=Tanacetum coccineum TaxID=301880 RepID=A0ABQ4Z099_9ASTR
MRLTPSEILAQSEEALALLVEQTEFLTPVTSHKHEGFPDFVGSLVPMSMSPAISFDPLIQATSQTIKPLDEDDDVVVLENSETKEENVKEDESDHNKERYTFEDDDDDGNLMT